MSQTPAHHGKRVTWAELFFDLVFVFGILQVTGLLAVHHQWWGIGRGLVVLVPIYVTWVAATMQTNRRGQDTGRERVGLFAIGLCGMVMAVAIPHAYEDGGLLFAVAYVLSRVVLVMRYPPRRRDDLVRPFSAALVLSGPLVFLGALLPDPWRETVWAVAALVDLAMPLIVRRRISSLVYEGQHLAERFGLFVLIALGESITDLGLPLARQPQLASPLELAALVTAFVMACALWWTYFDAFSEALARRLVQAAETRTMIYHHVLFGHLGLIAAVVTIAIGFENMVTQPGDQLTLTHLSLLYVGTVVFLLCISYIWWVESRHVRGTRIAAAVVILALLPVATQLPALAAVLLVTLVLLALNVMERRRSRPAFRHPIDEAAQS